LVKDKRIKRFIKTIADRIRETYQPEQIILFGSYAYGIPNEGSDIDILIIKDTPDRPIDRRVRVRRIVDIREPISFSPIVITPAELSSRLKAGDQFLKEVIAKGVVLYAR
jgi:predicted nucleotidyltransferase